MKEIDPDEIPDRESYAFDKCEPNKWYQFDKGIDFTGSPSQAQMAAYIFARRRNMGVRTRRNEHQGWLQLCFTRPTKDGDASIEPDLPPELLAADHPHPEKWTRPTLAEHIAFQHPEHIHPKLIGLKRWIMEELTDTHNELHARRDRAR